MRLVDKVNAVTRKNQATKQNQVTKRNDVTIMDQANKIMIHTKKEELRKNHGKSWLGWKNEMQRRGVFGDKLEADLAGIVLLRVGQAPLAALAALEALAALAALADHRDRRRTMLLRVTTR